MGRDSDTLPPPPEERPRMKIARIAIERSKPIAREEPDSERMAQLMSQLEGNLLAKLAELRDDVEDRPSRVQVEMAPIPPPEKKHWLHSVGGTLTGVAAVLAGLTALTGAGAALWAQMKPAPPVDWSKDVAALKRGQLLSNQQFQLQSKYDIAFRDQTRRYFEAMGMKVPPAPGESAPASDPAELLPTPLGDPHKITKTSRVQPRDPLPLPPPLPSEFDSPKP